MKIAITFRDDLNDSALWFSNGIAQNIKFYYDLFELMGHDVVMLVSKDTSLQFKDKKYATITYQKAVDTKLAIDLVIDAAVTIPVQDQAYLRDVCGAKIIAIRCGNPYTFIVEGLFLKHELQPHAFVCGYDHVCLLPHHGKQASILSTIHHCPTTVVPYIWEPDFVEKRFTQHQKQEKPNIYVMEPNINYVKNALVPMLILERVYEKAPNSFNKAVIFNSHTFYDKEYFIHNFVDNLKVLQSQNQKVFFDTRYSINQIFDAPHILLGHQVDNDLNYLYNEALYMGIPLVHNAPSYHSCGFYYPELEVEQGAEQLLSAIENYQPKKALAMNEELLYQFSMHNPKVQDAYNSLFQTVLNTD